MKYKTTDKQQRENNYIVAGFGYCAIQNIERYLSANAYTAGVYGWRADFYEFGALTISTGYAPLDYVYDKKAKKQAEFIKAEIRKLEKQLEKRRFAFQKSGDYYKGNKFITKKINDIYQKSLQIAE